MATNEQRERLKEYLLEQQARRAKMESPEFRRMQDDQAMRAADSASRNNFAATLMKSAAQMGTIGGRTADASPVEDFARAQNANNAQYRDNLAKQDEAAEKRYGLDARVYQYLADKEASQQQHEATAKYRSDVLNQAKSKAEKDEADRLADNKRADEQFAATQALKREELAQAKALREKELAANAVKDAAKGPVVPKDVEKEIETITTKNAGIRTNSNMMKAQLAEYQNAKTEADKVRIGNSMLKTLNSLISADAISEGDAKRLGDALEFQIANFRGAGKAFGRDLEGFNTQAKALINSADVTADMNDNRVDELYGRPKRHAVKGPNLGPSGEIQESGTAVAAPQGKTVAKQFRSKNGKKLRTVYSDGTEEITDVAP